MERARQAIRALIDLSPRDALVRRGNAEHRVAVADVRIGEEIVLRPGDKVPLDGVVVEGRSDVNEAPLTGESLPIDKARGDEIYAGTINGHGALEVRVTRLVRDTRLARIIHLVETAQAQPRAGPVVRGSLRAVVYAGGHRARPRHRAGAGRERDGRRRHLAVSLARAARHRLSVRAGDLHAGFGRGRAVRGGPQRRPDQGGRLPRTARRRPCRRVRQDRDADERGIAGDRCGAGRRRIRARRPSVCRRGRVTLGTPDREGDHAPRGGRTAWIFLRVSSFRSIPGMGAEAEVAGHVVIVGNARMMSERHVTMPADPGTLAAGAWRALGRVRRRGRNRSPARSHWRIGLDRRRARRSSCCASTGFVTSRC